MTPRKRAELAKVWRIVREDSPIGAADVAERAGIKRTVASEHLRELVRLGAIGRTGRSRGTRYTWTPPE